MCRVLKIVAGLYAGVMAGVLAWAGLDWYSHIYRPNHHL